MINPPIPFSKEEKEAEDVKQNIFENNKKQQNDNTNNR